MIPKLELSILVIIVIAPFLLACLIIGLLRVVRGIV